MKVELDREDLISLIKGVQPSYEQMSYPLCKREGRFNASYGVWSWFGSFSEYTEQELWDFYNYLKTPSTVPTSDKEPNADELWTIYNKGFDTGNHLMMEAARLELQRVGKWRMNK